MVSEFETLIAKGILKPLAGGSSIREYDIPALDHREISWMGWQNVIYRLVINDQACPTEHRYSIESDAEYTRGDVLVSTADPEEIEAWIEERANGASELKKKMGSG